MQVSKSKGKRGSPAPSHAALPSSSLEPLETAGQPPDPHISHKRFGSIDFNSCPPIDPLEAKFRHGGWAEDRRRVYDALMSTHQPDRRCDAFANCGSSLYLNRDGDELVLTSNHCHDRLCVPCQVARRQLLVKNVTSQITSSKRTVRFCTLTLRARECPLKDQLDRITLCFKGLRRREWWKANISGGAFFLEVKLGSGSGAWHVHAHCLVEGSFIDQRTLSSEWHAVTGDSYIVDVRAVPDAARRASYVTKYATKPADATVLRSPDHLQEFVTAIKGKRLFQCFGGWKDFALDDDDAPKRNLTVIGPIESLAARAREGDPSSLRFYEAALRKWPSLSHIFGEARPPPLDDRGTSLSESSL